MSSAELQIFNSPDVFYIILPFFFDCLIFLHSNIPVVTFPGRYIEWCSMSEKNFFNPFPLFFFLPISPFSSEFKLTDRNRGPFSYIKMNFPFFFLLKEKYRYFLTLYIYNRLIYIVIIQVTKRFLFKKWLWDEILILTCFFNLKK